MVAVYNNLLVPTEDANSGKIMGNRMFYNNDYMVSSTDQTKRLILTVFSGPAWQRLRLHTENVLHADEEYGMCQLAERSFLSSAKRK